ncbi:class I SAM-dependent DNA methyltransferase [Streptomyces sp. B-S-A8]|uniref:site-specific DNA-methyltransferase (adenine-specific) n=1 Tax=Streptomyces solicavernae TaxID=3043614 RepID=A0ABT6RXS1_9ACTN|nr:DNA methyltransferase [Streptomyces sp. B-S-A8]MDI3389115.1 class I SAM-dependent DNA methyltransferase [Streptomyces sp. B-S-A8]
MTYESLVNQGDYLSGHYLAEVLPKDLKAKEGLLARWAATEEEERRRHNRAVADAGRQGDPQTTVPPRARTPREGLRALHGPYFAARADFERDAAALAEPDAPVPADWPKRVAGLHLATLRALGYSEAHEQQVTVHRSGHEYTVQLAHAEPGLYAVSCGWTAKPDAALDPDGAGRLLHPVDLEASARLTDAKALCDFLFECDEPPRYVLLLVGGVLILADRMAWHEGRYLAVCLDAALTRRDPRNGGELDTVAALFGADSLRVPADGGTAPLAGFVDKSGKHAVGVSTELREGLRLSVEWIADEVLARLRTQGVRPRDLDDPARLAKQLTRESLRYLYRILFLLYAEAQPALGILPAGHPEYERGYGLQRLGDLVVRDLVSERSRSGYHLYESLDLLFRKVEKGHREYGTEPEDVRAEEARRAAAEAERDAADLLAASAITRAEHDDRLREADRARRAAERSEGAGLRFEPLRSELFATDAVQLISDDRIENPAYDACDPDSKPYLDTRLRNATLHKVLRRLMLTRGKGRERGGFISYAQLGINQLGAVYEGLMSYTGFIAEEDLYEVAKGGDPSGGSWLIPGGRIKDCPDEAFVVRPHEETGKPQRVVHPEGTFVYRLAGRDRQTSASYYTPKSLTEVTVELALRHRLDQNGGTTLARELLEWKICEPALGSGAFLNEAVDQVAAEYLRRRERELGRRIDPERRRLELQKAKAHIALHNAYGVDLNATAVELAEVSLWLNSMHTGMRAPWFGLHLRRGNSLIGAGRKVYAGDALEEGGWLAKKAPQAPRELPLRDGELPEGAVHQFLLPALGWGAVAGESEAKKLAAAEAKAMKAWRRGIQKAPKGPNPFKEQGKKKVTDRHTGEVTWRPETGKEHRARYAQWVNRAGKSELWRLQRLARRAEFLWNLVAKRLELSERKVSRHIDVWGADWLKAAPEATDKRKILDDLTGLGTPYWRLKTVMDAWCALWFWPLDKVAELDGTSVDYAGGGGVVTEADVARAVASRTAAPSVPAAPEPTGPAPGDQAWQADGLFAGLGGEQGEFEEAADSGSDSGSGADSGADSGAAGAASGGGEEQEQAEGPGQGKGGRGRAKEPTGRARGVIPLNDLTDWLDFLESLLGDRDPDTSFLAGLDDLDVDEALPVLEDYERDLHVVLGMDHGFAVRPKFPWLHTVEDIAGSTEKDIRPEEGHGFFHWELHFAHVFRGASGGFDLQVGNPPWVRPDWDEGLVLAEFDPWFKLADKPAAERWREQKDAALDVPARRQAYLGELATIVGTSGFLSDRTTYPLIAGTRPDLYRGFMCQVWRHFGGGGVAGLVHPDTHFSGVKEGRLRGAAYRHLRTHGHFSNRRGVFGEIHANTEFGVQIYGEAQEPRFTHLSWLFDPSTLRDSFDHDGKGELPGIKSDGKWDVRPHQARLVEVDGNLLGQWHRLSGNTEVPEGQAALLYPVTTQEQGAVEALAGVGDRLGGHEPRITIGMFENLATKKLGLYRWDTQSVKSLGDVILQGPHLGVALPFNKQPNIPCRTNRDWSSWDLTALPVDAVPVTNYVRDCGPERFRGVQDRWLDRSRLKAEWEPSPDEWEQREQVLKDEELELSEDEQRELLRTRLWWFRPYTEFYRLAWRRMIPFDSERSLFAALIPPGPAHVDAVNSAALDDNRATALNVGLWASLPIDYLLRITGRSDLRVAEARKMPYADPAHPLAAPLLLRTLRLNCLTEAYAPLWAELYDMTWPGYEDWAVEWPDLAPLAGHLKSAWDHGTPLRTERERRAALVEIDALVAVWLGMSADELVAVYKARYAILADYESETWFDVNGRKIARNHNTYGHGQTKQHYEDFLAYEKKERAEPPEPYVAPFHKADREGEMRAAHAVFEARLKKAWLG